MSNMAAFLAGFGTSYINGKKDERDRERQDERDRQDKALFDAKMKDVNRQETDRADLRDAGAPVQVREESGPPTPAMFAATPEGQTPGPIGYLAGQGQYAKQFAEQGLANTYAKEQSTPEARRTRMSDLAAQGNLGAGQALMQDAQIRNSTAQATNAEQDIADKAVRRSIDGLKTHDNVGAFITQSPADNQGGKLSVRPVKAADGMVDYMQVMPDGSLKPTGQRFTDDAAGVEKARYTLAGYLKPEQRMQQYQHEEALRIDAEKGKQDQKNKDRDFGLRESDSKANRANDAARLGLERQRLAASMAPAAPAANPIWDKSADEHLVKLYTSKNPESGAEEFDGHGMQFAQTIALDASRKNGGNMAAAIASASDIDNALKTLSKGDPMVLRQLREKALTDARRPQMSAGSARMTKQTEAEMVASTPRGKDAVKAQVKASSLVKLKTDPNIPILQNKVSEALRNGNSIEANSYIAQINEIKRSYGL